MIERATGGKMTQREGRQLLERVLERLNYEHVMARDDYDWHAAVGASEICCDLIRRWNRPGLLQRRGAPDRHDVRGEDARKVAA